MISIQSFGYSQKIGIQTIIQGFWSNKFELQIWNIFEIKFQNWFEDLNQGFWKFDKRLLILTQNLYSKEKNFDILSDIGVGLGLGMKFKSRDLDFNEFPILKRFKSFLNRKFEIWSKDSKFKSSTFNQGHF
jgi:hypothetical protein